MMKSLALYSFTVFTVVTAFTLTADGQRRHGNVKVPPARVVTNCPGSGLTDAEVADILAEHNKQRLKVHTAPVAWDCHLGAIAAAWAAKGTFGHSQTALGENLFVASDPEEKVAKGPDKWQDEEHHWHNKTGECE